VAHRRSAHVLFDAGAAVQIGLDLHRELKNQSTEYLNIRVQRNF
jgi:hypothetical protein